MPTTYDLPIHTNKLVWLWSNTLQIYSPLKLDYGVCQLLHKISTMHSSTLHEWIKLKL